MKKSLFLRTEVLPEEVPALYSNKNVHASFTKVAMENNKEINNGINTIVTVPYYFDIPKDNYSIREMSLLHPLAQIQSYIYTLKYEQLIIEFCSKSNFSVRSPSKLNSFKFDQVKGLNAIKDKLNEEYSFSKDINVTTEEDKLLYFNYYSYKPYKSIRELHNSPKFNRQKYKYDYYIKLDIQNFFPSIYSHGIAWAIFGDKALAKQNQTKELFANATDKIVQIINFNETNGLIVGPEFARVMAEVLLTRVDLELHRQLKDANRIMNRDYVINRFIDDFYIFTKDETIAIEIEEKLSNILQLYKLKLNREKRSIQKRPFKIYNKSIINLKSILSEFNANNLYSFIRYKDNISRFLEFEKIEKVIGVRENPLFIPATKRNWETLFNQIEKLIYENKDDSGKIVNYFLKSVRGDVSYQGRNPWKTMKSLEIVRSVYSLDINYKSTYILISIYIKLIMQVKKLEDDHINESENQSILSNLEMLNESIFHNSYFLLKNNFKQIDQMYDLIVFMKQLDKPLDSQFLCRILNGFKDNYFVLCSVAYYILNDDLTKVDSRYRTVYAVLKKKINFFHEEYRVKGAKHKGLEGHYFYIINDFSYYPGFEEPLRKSLGMTMNSTFEDHLKKLVNNKSIIPGNKEIKNRIKEKHYNITDEKLDELFKDERGKLKVERENKMKEVWGYVTKQSYYQWDKTPEDFSKMIVKKTMNISLKDPLEEY